MRSNYSNFNQLYSEIFKGKTSNTLYQLIRYTFVGGFAFVIDFTILFLLTEYMGINYLLSALFAFVIGLLTNYLLSRKWVFRDSSINNQYIEFSFFTLIGIFGLLLTEVLMWTFTDLMGLYYIVSKLLVTIIVYLWNFFARKFLIFNK